MMTRRMVVIIAAASAVVGLVTVALLIPRCAGRVVHSNIAFTRADIMSAMTAVEVYKQDCGSYPSEREGIQALLRNPGFVRWQGPYFRDGRAPTDDWGTPLKYSVVIGSGTNASPKPLITSAGPDRKFGTKDDITGP